MPPQSSVGITLSPLTPVIIDQLSTQDCELLKGRNHVLISWVSHMLAAEVLTE